MSEVIDVSPEFIEESKLYQTIPQRKGGPYSKKDKKTRRDAIYKMHFEYGYSERKISDLTKINRSTINSDINYLYQKLPNILNEFGFDSFVTKNMIRLEASRTRLYEMLVKEKNFDRKLTLENMVNDLEIKLCNIMLRVFDSGYKRNIFAIQVTNKEFEKQKTHERFYSPWEGILISEAKRKEINKILRRELLE